ncbi:MAG: caspase family protein [Rhodoferax sp.]|nr:caspase family protein [Rhodoferax sp.]
MKRQTVARVKIAHSATYSIAFAVTLLCATSWQPGMAQTGPGKAKALAPGERNLQVQAAASTGINHSQRLALIIGNSAYKDAPLTNPVNDARAIAQALRDSGFTVITRENIDHRGMLAALREFGDRLRAGGTGLFYYAGHGMQIKGRNYLIPVGANIDREDEVAYSAVDAQAVLDKMEAAGNVANIMILDACRNNPFTRSMRSGQAGLAQMDAPVGTLLAYATSPGAVASDGSGANGLYTQHLLNAIAQPGNKVEDVFKQVRANVRRDSQGKQVPWESTSLEGDFYFRNPPAPAKPVDPAQGMEAALWDAVKDSKLALELQVYLNRYPAGIFSAEAMKRVSLLQAASTERTAAESARKAATERASAEATRKATAERATAEAVQRATAERVTAEAANKAAEERASVDAANKAEAESALAHAKDQSALQTAIDNRTAELMASLAAPAKPLPAATPAAEKKPAPPSAASNSLGFMVGDSYRYQIVDSWKKEVVGNENFKISKILANGDVEWNDGKLITSPDGAYRRSARKQGTYEYSPQLEWIPKELRVGYRQSVEYSVNRTTDAFEQIEKHKGTLVAKSMEKVKVPAGEFEAFRIESETDFTGERNNGSRGWYGHATVVLWYVPTLRRYVAVDQEIYINGRLDTRQRFELTSFSVRGAQDLAQR